MSSSVLVIGLIGFELTRYLVNLARTLTLGIRLLILHLIQLKALTFDLRAWVTCQRLIPTMQTTRTF